MHYFIRPDGVESYKQTTLENARLTAQEPGVLRFDVCQEIEDPTHISLLEIYLDKATQESHL